MLRQVQTTVQKPAVNKGIPGKVTVRRRTNLHIGPKFLKQLTAAEVA